MVYRPKRSGGRAFTLIEVLFVVVILGILAGVTLAAYGSAVAETRQTALTMTLKQFRSQVEAYRTQHSVTSPDGSTLLDVLLHTTDGAGNVGTGDKYTFGPYLLSLPLNPYNGRSDLKVIPAGGDLTADNSTGWLYRPEESGFTLEPNTTGTDTAGKAFVQY